jgi:hypothetical protein
MEPTDREEQVSQRYRSSMSDQDFCELDYNKKLTITLIVIVSILIVLAIIMTILGLCGVFNTSTNKNALALDHAGNPLADSSNHSDGSAIVNIKGMETKPKHIHSSKDGIYVSNKVLFDLNRPMTTSSVEYQAASGIKDFAFHVAFVLQNVTKSTVLFTNSYQNLGQIILSVEQGCVALGVHGNSDHLLKTTTVLENGVNYIAQIGYSVENDTPQLELVIVNDKSVILDEVRHPLPMNFEFSSDVFPLYVGGRCFEDHYLDLLGEEDKIYYISYAQEGEAKWSFTAQLDPLVYPLVFVSSTEESKANVEYALSWKPCAHVNKNI